MSQNSPGDNQARRPQRDDFNQERRDQISRLDAIRQAASERDRGIPDANDLARRRSVVAFAKRALPTLAILLLVSIAAWPEVTHLVSQNRAALREMARLRVESGNMENAVYRGLDEHQRPYTISARVTHQEGPDRVDLTNPVADILLPGSGWAQIHADRGIYMQHEQTLNLDGHVVLYRDDGTLLNGPSADLDLKHDVVASRDGVHAEGPFGTEDAQGYFLDQHEGIMQFTGSGRTVRFDDTNTGAQPKQNSPSQGAPTAP
ncbi:hypothetical protein AA106555_0789 [Neokomagataea thailandica NBRC 106555]|uniref:LPS export ABC transporter periplasmic protein LptC n=2 Tax=Neokomagataea TaxID=1223423 RepID=A0A4Y6V505_9PROT|nr:MULTISPECIES: LPS export ABC transporter periplasmic protein LptC [Neokomagataea]QDH25129.1 LPS export ABC transporter periplasmic protein LptC [Neokomagataea tanensis]GBR52072.1 hypothetical protein AA106555_0789 [Neokomagataea thailandica NBRC 106555]